MCVLTQTDVHISAGQAGVHAVHTHISKPQMARQVTCVPRHTPDTPRTQLFIHRLTYTPTDIHSRSITTQR